MFVSSNSYVRVLFILIFFTSCNKEADIMKRNEVLIPYVISSSPDPLNILYSGDWAVTNHLWATLIDFLPLGVDTPDDLEEIRKILSK